MIPVLESGQDILMPRVTVDVGRRFLCPWIMRVLVVRILSEQKGAAAGAVACT